MIVAKLNMSVGEQKIEYNTGSFAVFALGMVAGYILKAQEIVAWTGWDIYWRASVVALVWGLISLPIGFLIMKRKLKKAMAENEEFQEAKDAFAEELAKMIMDQRNQKRDLDIVDVEDNTDGCN